MKWTVGKEFWQRKADKALMDPRTKEPVRVDEEPCVTPNTHPLKHGGIIGGGCGTVKYRFQDGIDFCPQWLALKWADALHEPKPENLREG